MKRFGKVLALGLTGLLTLGTLPGPQLAGREKPPLRAAARTPFAWTLDDALDQLHLHPRDPYLQYVAMQLARRENRVAEVSGEVGKAIHGDAWEEDEGRHADLFDLFRGAPAVQEGLQLDTMRDMAPGTFEARPGQAGNEFGPRAKKIERAAIRGGALGGRVVPCAPCAPGGDEQLSTETVCAIMTGVSAGPAPAGFPAALPWGAALVQADWENVQPLLAQAAEEKQENDARAEFEKRKRQRVKVATLAGPELATRPWKTLLGGKTPGVSHLSLHVPEDFYLAEFKSLSKMLDFLDLAGQWAGYLNHQAERDARTSDAGTRLRRQLALDGDDALRPLYDLAVEETAVTGSDLFLRAGSDVTVLFRLRQPQAFRARMDSALAETRTSRPDVREKTGKLLDFDYVHLGTPDRSVWVWSAYPEPGLHVRSNSEAALRRVLEAVHGKYPDGRPVPRLGAGAELRYVRTLLPRAAAEEDGFVYLSEPFLRRMAGPRLKLTERRRRLAYNHLRMIGHAAQLYRTEHGRAPRSLEDLAKAECCPGKFNEGVLVCPFGGKYSLSADRLAGVCSHCGTAAFLKPCCEIDPEQVDGVEAEEYKTFVSGWSADWTGIFSPIAARVRMTAKRCRVEALVLPPQDDNLRAALAQAVSGPPEPLDALPVPKRNLFSCSVRFNKEEVLKWLRDALEEPLTSQRASTAAAVADCFLADPLGLPPAGAPWRALAPLEEEAQVCVVRKVPAAVITRKWGADVKDVLDCFLGTPGAMGPAAIPWRLLASIGEEDNRREPVVTVREKSVLVKRIPLVDPDGTPSRRLTRNEALERDLLALAGDFEQVLEKGVGNQAALHVYDAAINFDFSLENVGSELLALARDAKTGGLEKMLGGEVLMMTLAAAPVLAPGYVSVPVRDARLVDDFLAKADRVLATLARQRQGAGPFQIEQEYYKVNGHGKEMTRSYGVRVGPVRLRLFWARIGDGLYLANQTAVLNDIRAAHAARARSAAKAEEGPVGHAMIRLRPRNWDQALAGFRLAWAENNREACLHNLGPLSSGARAFCAGAAQQGLSWDRRADEARGHAERLYGLGFRCPEGGKYLLARDGKAVTCSVHGSGLDPRQPEAPAPDGALERLMRDFADLSVTATAGRDALRAVLVIERR